jgi:Bax protein
MREITALKPTDVLMLGLLLVLLAISFLNVPTSYSSTTQQAAATDSKPLETRSIGHASKILPREPTAATATSGQTSELPDFAAIQDTATKKREFFNYMLPMIRESNDKIREERRQLLRIADMIKTGTNIDSSDLDFVGGLQVRYRVRHQGDLSATVDALLIRVDVVPASLVLAQAANESGWGTSRFARQANNMFGVWCFTKGCGLTPLARAEGLTHEVARYDSVQDSIDAYIRTLNTNSAYVELRDIRANSREMAEHFTGHELAEGLLRYSERGKDYVEEIKMMIRVNDLHRYTLPIQV